MDAETATVLRGRAKAALTRTKNFIDKDDQTFDKNDIRSKLEKLELSYTQFDKAEVALPIKSSEMKEFETKYFETKSKLQNTLENLSVITDVYNDNSDVFENVSNMKSSNFTLPKINIENFSETKTAEETIIRWVQGIHFQEEIQSIKKQICLPPKSPLRSPYPFIDEHGLTTKSVHIEAVRDLTTDSFIAALHRFSARRGGHRPHL
ncbi:hypothetical protein TNCV_1784601 [Trichonephila clavipes]|nr:hypothetical protein TNCV_1784601 [Trichonephila clavipes]